jgi:hypothetical protein
VTDVQQPRLIVTLLAGLIEEVTFWPVRLAGQTVCRWSGHALVLGGNKDLEVDDGTVWHVPAAVCCSRCGRYWPVEGKTAG